MFNNAENKPQPIGLIKYTCLALFGLFSLFFLYFIQGEFLAQAQFVFSKGVTVYSIAGGAVIITVVLLAIQWIVAKLIWFPQNMYALSFVPSSLLLGILTNMSSDSLEKFTLGIWTWLIPVLLVVFGILIYVLNKRGQSPDTERTAGAIAAPNFIILIVCILAVGSLSRISDSYMYELKAERLVMEKEYAAVSEVGLKSLATTRRLTEIRMYALAQQDRLADDMFKYPQPYGASGLLDVADTTGHYRFDSRNVCITLGAISGPTVKNTKRYLSLMVERDTVHSKKLRDYSLCYKLLDNDLAGFSKQLTEFYSYTDSLPRAYKEALLISMGEKDFLQYTGDTATISRYKEYADLAKEYSDPTQRKNKLRRQFGDTYWWYHTYGKEGY